MVAAVKIALVHDWLLGMRGGERVLDALCELYPDAPIYTLFYDSARVSARIQAHRVYASWLNRLPGVRCYYRWLLPLFPFVIRQFRIAGYDVVISSSHCVAKGVRLPPETLHICYCHTPMRYAWGFFDEYFGGFPRPVRWLLRGVVAWLRYWDRRTAAGVHEFVTNSRYVAARIQRTYGRTATVIHPPVDVAFFAAPAA